MRRLTALVVATVMVFMSCGAPVAVADDPVVYVACELRLEPNDSDLRQWRWEAWAYGLLLNSGLAIDRDYAYTKCFNAGMRHRPVGGEQVVVVFPGVVED